MTDENPWRTLSSRITYENPWFRVREDQVVRPDGKPGIYGVIETRIATGVVALTPENEVYLVGQYRYPTEQYSWEIIEGGAEESEAPIEAAMRELREEAGLVAGKITPLGEEVHLSNCFTSEVAYFFLARELLSVPSAPDGTEVLTVRRVSIVEALRMVDCGEIKDAMSIIALLRAERALRLGACAMKHKRRRPP